MKKKTLLFVMPRLPFPTTSGRKTSLYNYCKILSKSLGYRVIVAAFLEKDDNKDLKPDFIDKLVVLPEENRIVKIKNILLKSLVKKELPIQSSLYLCKKAKCIINELIEEEKPDVVIADMIRTTEYLKDFNGYKIADLDDRISLRYKRQLEKDFKNVNPYGAFADKIPSFLRTIIMLSPIKKYITKNEIILLNKYETKLGDIYDKVIFVAEKESDDYNKELGKKVAYDIPNGVDINFFKTQKKVKKDQVVFLGALNVSHNENAVLNFIENIFPYVQEANPSITFVIVGGGASERLLKYESSSIIFTGKVDDVRKYLSESKVFVCPMTFGSGIKTKNLEAMAMGMAVITSSIGAENINAIDRKDWIIEDNNKEFAKSIIEIINNNDYRESIEKNAREFIEKNFTWEVTEKKFKKIL